MESTNLNRRLFLRGRRPSIESDAIRPPWTIEATEFVDVCERCDACIQNCPEKILFKGDGGYPEVDFKRGECTFCAKCVDSCHTQAFHYSKNNPSRTINTKPNIPWHLKVTIKPNCLSLNAVVCRACGDNCDEQAINFRLQLRGVSIPEVDHEVCTGCGKCLYICPESAVSIQNKTKKSC